MEVGAAGAADFPVTVAAGLAVDFADGRLQAARENIVTAVKTISKNRLCLICFSPFAFIATL
jgi:hypothetical protein